MPSGDETGDFTVQPHKLLLYSIYSTLSRLILIRLDAGLRVVSGVSLYIFSYFVIPFYTFHLSVPVPEVYSVAL